MLESGLLTGEESFLAKGADSTVYRLGENVVKKYGSITPQQLLLYKNLTEQADGILRDEPYQHEFTLDGNKWGINVSVNPIIDIAHPPGSELYALSKYIPGPSLEHARFPELASAEIDRLEDSNEREFLRRLFEQVGGNSRRKPLKFNKVTSALTEQIKRKTGVKNVLIIGRNVKARGDMDNRVLQLTVTDVATHIKGLTFPTQ